MTPRRPIRWPGGQLSLILGLLMLTSCTPRPEVTNLTPARPPVVRSPHRPGRIGYTLQAGAFAQVENAARFSAALQAQGLDAAYYASRDGLFRVRFGDFPSKAEARRRGESLRDQGLIEGFWVVAPDGSAPGASGDPLRHAGDEAGLRAGLVASARSYLGVPYLFGGTTDRGFDCSGLTGAVYRLNGLSLPRSSRHQFGAGTAVTLAAIHPGDLVFFDTTGDGQANHVGIFIGGSRFIHAPRSGQVIREDLLDDHYFQRRLLGARCYL